MGNLTGSLFDNSGGSLVVTDLAVDGTTVVVDETNDRVGIGLATPKTRLTVEGAVTLKEQASADSDTAAYGQMWVKTATPNELYFTTDAGDDIQITSGTATAFVGDITGVTAGDGLSGGGTTGALSLAVGGGTGIDVAADAISVDVSDFMANGSDNRIVTATGTDAMNAEANLSFDGSTLAVTGALTTTTTATVGTDLTVTGGDINFGATTSTVAVASTAHDAAGAALSISAGGTTAGTTNNIAGGSVTINGGQGKGTGAGGDIIFKTANAGTSGSSLNALATALTLSDDTSATFEGAVIIKAPLASSGANGTFGTFADGDGTPSVGTGNLWKHHASIQTITMFDDGIPGQIITVISTAAITYDVTSSSLKGGSTDIVTADGDVTQWCFDGTNWYLLQFMDVSADHSTIGGGGGGGAAANDLDHILHQQVFGR